MSSASSPLIALLVLAMAHPPLARGDTPIINDAPRPHLEIPPAPEPPPLLTAQPDDPAWSHAATILLDTPSLTSSPAPQRPIPKTEVRAMWSPDWLYLRFACSGNGAPYTPPPSPSGSLSNGDVVEIFLDPMGDCRQWFELQFNSAGHRFVQETVCTGEPKWDASLHLTGEFIARDSWSFQDSSMNGVRSAAGPWQMDGKTNGWIVDVALPAAPILKRAGLKKFAPMTLRGNLLRYQYSAVPGTGKRDLLALNWSPVVLGAPHRSPAAFGFFDLSTSQTSPHPHASLSP